MRVLYELTVIRAFIAHRFAQSGTGALSQFALLILKSTFDICVSPFVYIIAILFPAFIIWIVDATIVLYR